MGDDQGSTKDGFLAKRRISRRSLLVTGGALGVVGVLSPLLAACGSDEDTPAATTSTGGGSGSTAPTRPAGTTTTGSSGTTSGETPVSGGILNLGYTEPPTMDPRVSGATIAWRLFYNLFDPLVGQSDKDGEFLPGLADAWEVSPDGKTYTFKLKQGVKFHDGTAFDAEAVKYTFDSTMDPELKSLTAIGYLGPYDKTEVVDANTARVLFKEGYAPFLNNLSHSVLSPVSPAAAQRLGPNGFGLNPVGTGPFMFKGWKEKISMTFVKNPDYNWPPGVYQHKGPAYLDQIVVKFIPEDATRHGTLINGESQVVDGVLPQEVKKLQGDKNYQVLLPSVPGSPQILPMNATKAPTDELAVRQAIIHAIDMDSVINTLWFGTRKTAKGPLSSPTWSYNANVEKMYPFDTKKANQLLDDAGWKKGSGGVREKNGQQLVVEYVTVTGIQGRAGELIQAYLTDVGFKVNLQQLEYAATATLMLAGKHNIARIYFSHTDPVVLTTLYHTKNIQGTNFNRTMKPDAKLDKLLEDATSESNRDKRKQIYMDIQQYIMDEALIIPLWEETVFWGATSKVKDIRFQPLGGIWFYDVWMQK